MKQKRNLLYGIIIIIAFWYLLSLLLDERLIPVPHTVFLLFGSLSIKGILPRHAPFSLFRLVAALKFPGWTGSCLPSSISSILCQR